MSVAAGIDRNPIIAKILSEYFPKAEDRKNARILDLAAGTGLVGHDLYKEGFTNIDGVDFSEAMLVELRKKNVYTKDYCGRLGDNTDPICGIPDGSYDVVVIAGGFAHGHLNIQVLRLIHESKWPGLFQVCRKL